jgi:putative membrane protein
MVATPLVRRGRRAMVTNAVVAGLFGLTLSAAARRWGGRRALTSAVAVAGLTAGVEQLGARRGVPFGPYRYTGALGPAIGGIPVAVPLAWFAMAVPARETAHALRATALARAVVGASCLTAWDLFLDPQMVGEGYWVWSRPGRYRGIPLSNFAGWFVTGLLVCTALEGLLPARRSDRPVIAHTGTYAGVAVMETLGFAVFFRDPLVAAAGGTATLAPATIALVRSVQRG